MVKSNITPKIKEKLGKNLHNQKNHPIEIIKNKIYKYFGESFEKFDSFDPKVNTVENFDNLLIEKDHPSRRLSDTYYIDDETVLRTHTSAHQNELLRNGHKKFLVTGDVYRKDEIDTKHYPIFHQTEGVCIVDDGVDPKEELIKVLSGLVEYLFPNCKYRFNEDYFPFTTSSFEVEVEFEGKWMEILGCGVVHEKIMNNCNLNNKKAWAFGLGLERFAMMLFDIPDIRYFWSDDERFLKQFENGKETKFQPYSKYPSILRDISFWANKDKYSYNDFCEILRESGGDLIESIELKDEFIHPKTQRQSYCFRIIYRSNDRTLTSEEIDQIQNVVREKIVFELEVELR
jgi:phenylalanyl-tRNA synthetase alpha chain